MPSIRKKLTAEENPNDCKNTRMNIAHAGVFANFRPDEIAHMSRFEKIASFLIDESKRQGRPLDTLEIGCGEVWVLRTLYKSYVVKKSDVISSYYGYDIDPASFQEIQYWSGNGCHLDETTWLKNFNATLEIKDVSVDPILPHNNESIDVAWSTEVIEHMPREAVEPWIAELSRVVKKGGTVFISTPNHDGSNDKLPEDHIYEWGFQELKDLLERYFQLESVVGVFTQMRRFNQAQRAKQIWTPEQLSMLEERFGRQFLRVAAATFYPETSNNCFWRLSK